jgi:hypothetical protein
MKYCDGTTALTPCPHPDECTVSCGFNDAVVLRKVKPYPHVPPEIEDEGSDDIAKFGNAVLWVIRIFLIVWAGVMLASGMFLWSLFI